MLPHFNSMLTWIVPSFDAPSIDFTTIPNGEYEKWVCQNYLRVNRFNDVEPYSCLSLSDNVDLPIIADTPDNKTLYKSIFEEIRDIFINTRKMLYGIIREDENSMNVEMLKMAYKNIYSIFDKIAMFLSTYLGIKLKPYEINMAKIWNCKNGDIRPEIRGCVKTP